MDPLLTGQTALITGAGANIGRAIALEMARHGATIHFAEIDADRLALVQDELRALGADAHGHLTDVSDPQDIERLCRTLDDRDVAIDILVNNVAARRRPRDVDDCDFGAFQAAFATAVSGPMTITRHAVQGMTRDRRAGSILFISSIHQSTVSEDPIYGAVKGATGMLIRELAAKLASHGIRVNGIAPGYVAADAAGDPVPHRHTPLHGTAVAPEYVARAAVMLCSDTVSRHTTGTVLTVDGGLSLHSHLMDAPSGNWLWGLLATHGR